MLDKLTADQKRQLWQAHSSKWQESKLSLAQWSKEQGVDYCQSLYCTDRILGRQSYAGFVELRETRSKA